jgi:cytoskeletal protein CcmA (bactofilin family)
MFSKPADPTLPPARPAGAGSNVRSVLGSDLKIVGEVTSTGQVEVLGEVDGTLQAAALIVGAEGKVTGDIAADMVEIKGRLEGKVQSQAFTLRAAAQVAADVNYSTLVIESGARIEGRFRLNK